MSRDRLREARNQQQGGQQQQGYGGGGYAQGGYAPQQQGGYSAPQQSYAPPQQQQYRQDYAPPPQQYQQPQHDSYAMQDYNGGGGGGGGGTGDMHTFFAEVESIQDEIKQLHNNVNQVSDLHSRRLATTNDAQQHESASYLTELTQATSALTNSIRNRITKLNEQNKRSPAGDPDFNTRKLQIGGLQNAFKRGLEEYNLVEKKSREKYRQRMERQIRIVKPDATQEEIKAAFDDSQGGQQIFSQALVQSRQSGARAAFAEVQSRNQDLRKIEETITQLAQMMQDMATLVLEQDESVRQIETTAVQANTDVESGLKQTQTAVKSARAARKKRWFCFGVIVVIIIVVVVVVVVEVLKNQNKA
ncbi:t-SNARE [Leucosporidium creatinivorum]|uniref:t-SNARE n=1 Tax=Leucosporidium creatinivorum TaxID=106004 RepID=A0A1Y2ENS5_9BASI|nr:t-SNARE [Leucosporidium creatinivorum]